MKHFQTLLPGITRSFLFILLMFSNTTYGQVVEIVANPSTSANVVFGTNLYAVNESIYTEAEIGATNFTSAGSAIDQVAYSVSTLGINPTFSNVNIWMKEVPLTTTSFTEGTYSTAGYTLVFTGSVTAAIVDWIPITLTTPFQRTAGTNLQVMVERTDAVAHTGYVYRSAGGNNESSLTNSSRRYNAAGQISASTVLSVSTFRPQIRLQHVYANDAMVKEIYSLGKLPIPFGTPHVIKANIINNSTNALTNIPVTLTIMGANDFTNMQTIPSLAAGTGTEVSFAEFAPVAVGSDSIIVSIPEDDFNGNNVKSVVQRVNYNTFSYSYGPAPAAAVGFNGTTGDFAVRFNTSSGTAISQVAVNFITGGQPFKVAIWDASGLNGTPGNLVYSSTVQTATPGIYVLPLLPAVPIAAGDFFVGVQQVGNTNVSFAYQNEDPIRLNTFYWAMPTGASNFSDLAPSYKFRFMIEPKIQLPIDANVSAIVLPAANCTSGPVNYGAVLTNVGTNTINAGAASVTLRIGGANIYTATVVNTTNITSGSSETIIFSGVNISNAGTNMDTAFVSLAGDAEQENDTLKTSNVSAAPVAITAFPAIENVEAALPLFPFFRIVSGSSQLWRLQTGAYSNADQTTGLSPLNGNRFFLFDSYRTGNSAGFASRLSSNCISLPNNTGANCAYKLRFYMSHDNTDALPGMDSLYVSVSTDNGVNWTRLLPGFQRSNAAYATPGWEKLEKDLGAYGGQTIQIGFEGVSKGGNAFGLDSIVVASVAAQELVLSPATNNGVQLTSQCDDQGWTYYSNPASPQAGLFAINWDPQNNGANAAAKASTTLTIQLDPNLFAAEDIPGKKATYTMNRYWNLDPVGAALTGPFNIRFFYAASEKTAVDNAATAFATANAGVLETASWFKTSTTDFVGDAAHVNADAVLDAMPLTDVNTGQNTINGLLYAQFNGLSGFSGGTYASGVGPSSPLPLTLVNFEVKRSGKVNKASWSTMLEQNTRKFVVERSGDGRHFSAIGEVGASGNSASPLHYAFTDQSPVNGINYYRLGILDLDNTVRYSAVRSVRNAGSADIAVYPNPVRNVLNVRINADKADRATLALTDISGKLVLTRSVQIVAGPNLVPVQVNSLSAGTYFIKITLSDDVVTSKFNKQ